MKNIFIKLIFSVSLLISTQSCSQQNQQQMNDKTTELLGNLYKDVKYVGQGASYHAVVSSGGATVEVYINGYPIHREIALTSGTTGGSNPINEYILKSGQQDWEVRVYPAYNVVNNDQIVQKKQISKETRFLVRLEKLSFDKNGNVKTLTEPITLIETPLKYEYDENNNEIESYNDAGKSVMVYKGTFNADVPYTLKGWSESVDLTKENQDELKKELVQKYQEFWKILDKSETDKYAEKIVNREQETAQSLYYTKELNDNYLKIFFDKITKENKKMKPLEDYKIVFYGNKMIALESSKALYKYQPALMSAFNIGERKKLITYYLAFHRPKPGAPLEIIR